MTENMAKERNSGITGIFMLVTMWMERCQDMDNLLGNIIQVTRFTQDSGRTPSKMGSASFKSVIKLFTDSTLTVKKYKN